MDRRPELHHTLKVILGSDNVYFQPKANVQMKYPAIVYARDYAQTIFASNLPYRHTKRYSVTYIDRDPDSLVPEAIAQLPMCIFNRHFVADNLNHDVYNIYF